MSAAGIYQLMVVTAWSDGELHELEQGEAGRLCVEIPALGALEDRPALAREARALLLQKGARRAAAELAEGIDEPGDQLLAVACCARVLAADGRLAVQEFGVLSELRRVFGLTVDEVERVLRACRAPTI